jgi:hypothetical protein
MMTSMKMKINHMINKMWDLFNKFGWMICLFIEYCSDQEVKYKEVEKEMELWSSYQIKSNSEPV